MLTDCNENHFAVSYSDYITCYKLEENKKLRLKQSKIALSMALHISVSYCTR